MRLVWRGNAFMDALFKSSVHSIRGLAANEAQAKGFYRFLHNDRVTEDDLITNLRHNCVEACGNRPVVCIQDTTEINLSAHRRRIKQDGFAGSITAGKDQGLGFYVHPCLTLDAESGLPYGFADVKLWSRSGPFTTKHQRGYGALPMAQKESNKWQEVSANTIEALHKTVRSIVVVQDREGDIYEYLALGTGGKPPLPVQRIDLLVRAASNRWMAGERRTKLFACFDNTPPQGHYSVTVAAKEKRQKRTAQVELRFQEVQIQRPRTASKDTPAVLSLYFIEAKEVGYAGEDALLWRLLTTLVITDVAAALQAVEWYSWRWMVEEVFKCVKKEGFDIEASELETAGCIRKLILLMMEVTIKLFLMRIAYGQEEQQGQSQAAAHLDAAACFTRDEQAVLEAQICQLEGTTQKQKCPFSIPGELRRYTWAIARLGGWKGYEGKNRHPGLTTLMNGLLKFQNIKEGWMLFRNVSTR